MNFSINETVNGYLVTTICSNLSGQYDAPSHKDSSYVFESLPGLQIWMSEKLTETFNKEKRNGEQLDLPFD